MNKFMRNKLFAKSKKTLALLLAATMVLTGVPATTVSAAETASTEVSANDGGEALAETAGTVDGAETGLAKYTLDLSDFENELTTRGVSSTVAYGSRAVRNSLWSSYYFEDYIYVKRDGVRYCSLYRLNAKEGLKYTYQWQVKKGETWENTTQPVYTSEPGSYQLVIEIPAKEDESEAMKEAIPFTITKAPMTVSASFDEVQPGTLVKDLKLSDLSASYYVYNNGTNTYNMTTDENSELAATVEVLDAYTRTKLADDAVLKQDGDYYVKVVSSFTDKVSAEEQARYTLPVVEKKLTMAGLTQSQVKVELAAKWQEDNQYCATYDGEDAKAPVAGTDYTMTVQVYEKNAEGYLEWKTITPAEGKVTYAWYENPAEAYKMSEAPVNAGSYYYGISYAGEAGMYAPSTTYIPVEVEARELVLVPTWKEGTPDFYPGMSEKDVLNWIDYEAQGALADFDKEHTWGTAVYSYGTLTYEPVFKLQVETTVGTGETATKTFVDNNGAVLQSGKNYRVIFSGEKANYYLSGYVNNRYDINSTTGGADTNYMVNTTTEVLEKNVKAVTVNPGVAAKIDVSAITPIVKTYDGEALYASRALYKLAKVVKLDDAGNVKVSDGTDASLTYTWYKVTDEDTDGNPIYSSVWTNDYFYQYKPIKDAGQYKLVVSYNDPENVWHAANAEIFYEIKQQPIQVVPVTVPTAMTGTQVQDYAFDEITYEIRKVTVGTQDGADGTQDGGDVVGLVEGEDYEFGWWNNGWTVESAVGENPKDEDYAEALGSFTEGTSYRVAVDSFYLYNDNYTATVETKDGEGNTVSESLHETKKIDLVKMGEKELNFKIGKLSTTVKEYDGKPWDISGDIAKGLVTITDATGNAVTDVQPEYRWYASYGDEWYDEEAEEGEAGEQAPYRAGTYTLKVGFSGNETYKAVTMKEIGTVTIGAKTLTVELPAKEPVVAATDRYDVYSASDLKFEGVVERDVQAFSYSSNSRFEALAGGYVRLCDETGETVSYVKGEASYTLTCEAYLYDPYASCYNVVAKPTTFTTVRGNATVEGDMITNGFDGPVISDTVTGMNHVIKPVEGVPYSYSAYFNGSDMPGNYVVVRIRVPQEYNYSVYGKNYYMHQDAVYRNSIEAAGGYILTENGRYINVAFDANAEKKEYDFSICWEAGYVENFKVDCTGAILEADLSMAVEPKSMSLLSPAKKMIVGSTQQLDVKLTTKQISDVVYLGYSVDDKSVLCVEEDGYITALKEGKATVTVYPAYYDYATDEMKAIAGAKTLKLTITVTNVSAPKIKKVQTWDNTAKVEVTALQSGDGYRREVYVLPGKGVTADTFEKEIAKMEQQNWEGTDFVCAPTRTYTQDSKTEYAYVYDMAPNTDYTVYVRNVSSGKNLYDGCKVSAVHNGSVKSFKTTKSQLQAMIVGFDEKQPVTYNEDEGRNEVKLTAKSVTVTAMGAFYEDAKNAAADSQDFIWKELPWDKTAKAEMKNSYAEPKLSYYVGQAYSYNPGNAFYHDTVDDVYYVPTSRASITKAGKLTLKAAGGVYIMAYDSVSGTWSDAVYLYITVNPDKITPNKVSLQVGQSIYLPNTVTYWEGKTKVTGSFDRKAVLSDASIKALQESGKFTVEATEDYTYITAVAPGTVSNIEVTDELYGISTKVSVTAKALTPISALKTVYVSDKYVDMTFNYNGYGNKFKVAVYDERGRLVSSDLYDAGDLYWKYEKKNCVYLLPLEDLFKSSKYTVEVTAVYDDGAGNHVESKAVKKAIKTTKVPVSYYTLGKNDMNDGMDIMVINHYSSLTDITAADFYTGNGYSLVAWGGNPTTADSLTWSSSNKKVATVKANANGSGLGYYSADLKALKSGSTVIEVKSKITKEVVARYRIYVDAVGDASNYSGDYFMAQSVETEMN